MMRFSLAIILALSLSGMSSAQDVEMLEGTYELQLSYVTMPANAADNTSFRTCADCQTVALRVNSATSYLINHQALALPDFLLAIDDIRQVSHPGSFVGVYYDLQTNQVTRISVVPHN